jgi:hypothetical protein
MWNVTEYSTDLNPAMANDGMLMATAAPVSRLTDLVRFDPMVSDDAQERESLFISLRFVVPNRWTGAQSRIANIDVVLLLFTLNHSALVEPPRLSLTAKLPFSSCSFRY